MNSPITLLILNWIYSYSFDQKVCLNSACLAQFLKFLDATNCFGINDKSPFINETTARCRCLAPSSSPLFCAFLSMALSSNMIHSFWVVPSQHPSATQDSNCVDIWKNSSKSEISLVAKSKISWVSKSEISWVSKTEISWVSKSEISWFSKSEISWVSKIEISGVSKSKIALYCKMKFLW